jgi:hypothetical protein
MFRMVSRVSIRCARKPSVGTRIGSRSLAGVDDGPGSVIIKLVPSSSAEKEQEKKETGQKDNDSDGDAYNRRSAYAGRPRRI